jgi:3-oxoacyl-[acyl-carrier protein] reductase
MTALEGRVALVTGGSRGIGAAICRVLAQRGADIAVNYNSNAEAAEKVAAEVRALDRTARIYQADVSDEAAAAAMCEQAIADFGKVDILVNNAGVGSSHVGRPLVTETKTDQIDWLVRTHIYGSMYMCRGLVPQMRGLDRGDVIMISSVAAQRMGATSGTYNVAKAGMEALAYTLAKEERQHNVRVNIVAPGLVDTDLGLQLMNMTQGVTDIHQLDESSPFGYVCTAEDIANAVAFLVSEEGRYITHQRITVNGGGF